MLRPAIKEIQNSFKKTILYKMGFRIINYFNIQKRREKRENLVHLETCSNDPWKPGLRILRTLELTSLEAWSKDP